MSKPAHSRKEYKAIARRIAQDAPRLVNLVRAGKTTKQLAKPHRISRVTFWRYLQRAVDAGTWKEIMHVGNPNHRKPKPKPEVDLEEVREEAGPHCFECKRPISRHTMVCPHCETNQWV